VNLTIRAAEAHELDDVLGVMDEAAGWLPTVGMGEQWPASFSRDPAWVERFRGWMGQGRVFLARVDDGAAVGCFRLLDADDHMWGDQPARALYLHSLAVRRSAAGQGLGQAMLDWALQHAASTGAEELRLDCWAGNERLKRYYAEAGVEARGETMVASEPEGEHAHRDYRVAKFAKKVG
jgi:GNAT superfamily N-acetyltransferase